MRSSLWKGMGWNQKVNSLEYISILLLISFCNCSVLTSNNNMNQNISIIDSVFEFSLYFYARTYQKICCFYFVFIIILFLITQCWIYFHTSRICRSIGCCLFRNNCKNEQMPLVYNLSRERRMNNCHHYLLFPLFRLILFSDEMFRFHVIRLQNFKDG